MVCFAFLKYQTRCLLRVIRLCIVRAALPHCPVQLMANLLAMPLPLDFAAGNDGDKSCDGRRTKTRSEKPSSNTQPNFSNHKLRVAESTASGAAQDTPGRARALRGLHAVAARHQKSRAEHPPAANHSTAPEPIA